MSDTTNYDRTISWRGLALRLAGIAFAAYLISKGWAFWPIVIVIACLA